MSIHDLCESDDPSFEQDLSMLLDGELDPLREADVRRHLDGCTHCSRLLATFGVVDRTLRAEALPEVPSALLRNIEAALERDPAGQALQDPRSERPQTAAESARRPNGPREAGVRQLARPRGGTWWRSAPWLALAASLVIYVAVNDPAVDFEQVPEEELGVALELDTIRDLDVIANLELVEQLAALGAG